MSTSGSSSYRDQTKNSKGIHVRLSDEILSKLTAHCEKRGVSRARAIESAISLYVARQDQIDEIVRRETSI